MNINDLQTMIRRRLVETGTSQHRAALDANLPEDAIRNILTGHMPRLDRAAEVFNALGLKFYIGPSGSPPRLDSHARNPEAALSQGTAESLAWYGAALLLERVRKLAIHYQAIIRTLLEGHEVSVMDVVGNYMAPTLCDGDWAVVDHTQREFRHDSIFVLSVEPVPVIRRIREDSDGLWGDCDNNRPGYDSVALRDDEKAIGRVMWWAHAEPH